MDFVQAVKEGLNQVAVEENDAGYIVTLTHNATTDNAVTCFILKNDVVCWANYEDEDEFDKAVTQLGTYEDQVEKLAQQIDDEGLDQEITLRQYIDQLRYPSQTSEEIVADIPEQQEPSFWRDTAVYAANTSMQFPDFSTARGGIRYDTVRPAYTNPAVIQYNAPPTVFYPDPAIDEWDEDNN